MKYIIEHHLLKNTEHKTLYILQKYIQPKYTLSGWEEEGEKKGEMGMESRDKRINNQNKSRNFAHNSDDNVPCTEERD